jgi:hypothetical protein
MGMRLLFGAFVLIVASASAFADVYRWTDTNGVTVFSSFPPEEGSGARNVVVVAKEKPRVIRGTRESVEDYASAKQQILANRIDSLERQVQAQQYAQASMAQYQAAYPSGYYTTPEPSYYSEPYYDPYNYPYYGYYPYSYPYTYYPPVTVFVRPRAFFPHRTFGRPFVHGAVVHGTFGRPVTHGFGRSGGFAHGGHGGRR